MSNEKDINRFVTGAPSKSDNNDSKQEKQYKSKGNTLSTYATRLQDKYILKIRAFAHFKRVSQRELIEKAMDEFFEGRQEELEEAVDIYRQEGQEL